MKAKRGRASAVSDWMEMERERGISITTSVLQFPYRGLQMNLLDTPGHADFSEDTYRTLHAVDGAVMLLDSAKGVEAQTRKLFRVCRQRAIPIFTFVNKLDRPGRDAFDLIGEVENVLGIGVYPVTWPIFRSGVFRGVYHRLRQRVYLFDAGRANSSSTTGAERPPVEVTGIDDPALREELDDARATTSSATTPSCSRWPATASTGSASRPGSSRPCSSAVAVNNFGLEAFLETFSELMPPPRARAVRRRAPSSRPGEEFSGFVFKIQANMDKAHRDRVAFVRDLLGQDGARDEGDPRPHRQGGPPRQPHPVPGPGAQRGGRVLRRRRGGHPRPGHLRDRRHPHRRLPLRLRGDPQLRARALPPAGAASIRMRRKQFATGIEQLAQEGTVQLYRPPAGRAGDLVLGALGQLQFEVVKYRLEAEYGVEVRVEAVPWVLARWPSRADGAPLDLEALQDAVEGMVVLDVRERPVVLFDRAWALQTAERVHPEYVFAETATGVVVRAA